MLNIIQLYKDYNIHYWTKGNNVQQGWVNVKCPFHNDSNHLGFNPVKNYFHCWNCGHHSIEKVLSHLLNISREQVRKLLPDYETRTLLKNNITKSTIKKVLELPGTDLTDRHRSYLIKRNFDPDYIIEKYKIKGTGITGDWRFRIMIPVFYKGQLVTYQGRDITDLQDSKYKNLSNEESIIPRGKIFYNFDNLPEKNTIIYICEGVFDVWRMGDGFVCSFGTSLSDVQIKLLSQFKKVVFIFDAEEEAQKKARQSAGKLATLGVECELVELTFGKDPADLSDLEAEELKYEISKLSR